MDFQSLQSKTEYESIQQVIDNCINKITTYQQKIAKEEKVLFEFLEKQHQLNLIKKVG